MKTQNIDKIDHLLKVRGEALKHAATLGIRPSGKWKGMDVFTWLNPKRDELVSTIKHFPFPVFWITTAEILSDVKSSNPEIIPMLAWIAQYNDAAFPLNQELAKSIPLVSASQNLNDALNLLEAKIQSKHIVLFTSNSENGGEDLTEFEQFLKK